MDFQGPQAADLANVRALNLEYLDVLRRRDKVTSSENGSEKRFVSRLVALNPSQSDRLARCPFLLFSLVETTGSRQARLLEDNLIPDLFDRPEHATESDARLLVAALGFLWELARRNPYATRLVSGASLAWCEQLAECSPLRLVKIAATEAARLSPRFADRSSFWEKMLGAGISDEDDVREAAQLCALQTVLTRSPAERYRQIPAAACAIPSPALRVADKAAKARRPQ